MKLFFASAAMALFAAAPGAGASEPARAVIKPVEASVPETMEVVSRNIAAAEEESANNDCRCESRGGQFCGTDGQCHFYSCKSWYEFGPLRSTGFDNTNPSQLVCQDIPITQPGPDGDVFYDSVSFRCRSFTLGSPIQMGFTNKCTVSTSNSNFECYGLAADTNFQPFLDEVAASQLNCTGDDQNDLDETGYPKFSYSVVTRTTHSHTSWAINSPAYNSTSEFNATLALTGTLFADYKQWTDEPTGAPTMAPTASPTWPMNSASFENESGMMAAVRLGVLYVFYLFL